MADTIKLVGLYQSYLSDTETLSGVGVKSSLKRLRHSLNTRQTITGALRAGGTLNLSGTTILNLTALVGYGSYGITVNATGFRLLAWKFQAPTTNRQTAFVQPDASNPYNLIAGVDWTFTYQPGEEELKFTNAKSPIVGSGQCQIDVTGTAGDQLNFEWIFG